MTSLAAPLFDNDHGARPSSLTRGRLGIAGLTPAEERVYLTLLDLPQVTVSAAHQACPGVNLSELHAILEALTDKGLLTECSGQPPRRYAPIAPQRALQATLDKQEQELRQTRAAVEFLAERYRAVPRPSTTDDLAEIVTGKQRTLHRWFTALGAATSQVRILCRPPFEVDSPEPHPAELDVLGKGIPVRCVYDESGLRNPAVLTRRKAEIAAGEQARVTGQVPLHLLLVDDNLALMPVGRDRPRSDGLLVVHPCALLDGLTALFELAWETALPLSLDPSPGPYGHPPVLQNPTTRTILGMLAAGLSDQSIARRLDCSERTIQRHILRLTEAVGAKTRFQAAVHIGRRGWTG